MITLSRGPALQLGEAGAVIWYGASSGPHSTIVVYGGEWGWPNNGEAQYLPVADSSWMQVGQTVHVDDGVHEGTMTISSLTEIEGFISFEPTDDGPPGGTPMLDGATITLVS